MPALSPAVRFVAVLVGRAATADFAVDEGNPGDPIAAWITHHGFLDEAPIRLAMDLVRGRRRFLDLGCAVGGYTLGAAALGASVLAVDANPGNVRHLRLAAAHNGFEHVRVVNAAVAADAGTVTFIPNQYWGRVGLPGESREDLIEVRAATVDRLLDEAGWDTVDVIKMDIEGSEIAALKGMRSLFERGVRPPILTECNSGCLEVFGHTADGLRSALEELGYQCLYVVRESQRELKPMPSGAVMPESVTDVLAVADLADVPEGWTVSSPLTVAELRSRVLAQCASSSAQYRAYGAQLLAHGPHALREDAEVEAAIRALELDESEMVRSVVNGRVRAVAPQPTA